MIKVSIELFKVEGFDQDALHHFKVSLIDQNKVLSNFKISCEQSLQVISLLTLPVPDEYETIVRSVIESYVNGYFRKPSVTTIGGVGVVKNYQGIIENDLIKCHFCDSVVQNIDEAIEKDWSPSFYIGNEETCSPVCHECTLKYLSYSDDDGELELKV